MIIVSEKELSAGSKSVEAASEFVEDAERPLDDALPPSYETLRSASGSSSPSAPAPGLNIVLPSDVKAANFVHVSSTYHAIKATYVIDPSLEIPSSLLPPLAEGETERYNLRLEAAYASVAVDVHVVSSGMGERKVAMLLKSNNSHINGRVHRSKAAPSFSLDASAAHGHINIHIPRSFCGSVSTQTTFGQVKFSNSVSQQLTTFSDLQGNLKGFIGDTAGYVASEGDNWPGDEIKVEAPFGRIRIQYDDEPGYKGLLGRLFGR